MLVNNCLNCNRLSDELNEGYCPDCEAKLMKEWEQARKDEIKYWEDTRL